MFFVSCGFVVSQLKSRFDITNGALVGVSCFARPEFLVHNTHYGPASLPLYEHYQEMP